MRRRGVLTLLVTVVILGIAAAGVGYWWLVQGFTQPGPAASTVRIQVEPGSTVRGVLRNLAEQGVLSDARRVELYLRVTRQHPNIKAGTYDIPARASPERILRMLESGE